MMSDVGETNKMTPEEKLEHFEWFLQVISWEDDPINFGPTLPVFAAKALSLDMSCSGCVHEYKNNKNVDLEVVEQCEQCSNASLWFPTPDCVNEYFDLLNADAEEE